MVIDITYDGYTISFKKDDFVLFRGEELSGSKWVLRDADSNTISVIQDSSPWYKISFNKSYIIDYRGQQLSGNLKVRKGPVYTLVMDNAYYRLIEHRGTVYSIFKGDVQIGAVKQEDISVGYSTVNRMILDDNADLAIVVTLFYMCMCRHTGHDTALTLNVGNIGPELQPFNDEWQPQKSNLLN